MRQMVELYRRMVPALLLGTLASMTFAGTLTATAGGTAQRPAQASDEAAPWTFWYWMYGAVSKAGIHADLMGMKDIGLGGCYLMPIRGTADRPEYGGTAQQLSPTFWEMVDYAFEQADSLGLSMGIHVSDGFALAGGPWVTPAESMQKVVWTDTIVAAEALHGAVLRRPETYDGYGEDIVAFALPVWDLARHQRWQPREVRLTGGMTRDENGTFRASVPGGIVYDLGLRRTVRSLEVMPAGNNIQSQRLTVRASDDGRQWHHVATLAPPRQGWQSTGPAFTYALPATAARYFAFDWTPEGTEPGAEDLDAAKWKPVLRLRQLVLSGEAKVDQWEGKSGAVWRVAAPTGATLSAADYVRLADVIPLTLSGDKVVTILSQHHAPRKGATPPYYRLLRFAHTSTGQQNATAGGGKGLEIDKFNTAAVDRQFDRWFGSFLARPHSAVVQALHIDSWECGTQNWGHRFAEEFRQRRGYDLLPYLLLYAGIPMESAPTTERVLLDVRRTVDELVNEKFFAQLQRRAHAVGRRVSHESIAPTFVADGMTHYKYADRPMGEYWLESPTHDKPSDMLDAVSGAHVYGKPLVQAEALTEVRGVWNETPAMVKPLVDLHFAIGVNKLFFHVTAHNLWTDRRPGMTLDGIGLFFQRDNTWYAEAGGLTQYIRRCQQWLQRGRPVVDIAVFTGEEMPRRALTPDRLVPMLPGLFGRERVDGEAARLANSGQPMVERPVDVSHAAGILEMRQWVNALGGYQYDSVNPDGLLGVDSVADGRIVMPGGCAYRVLVLPGKTKMDPRFDGYSDEVRQKIAACRQAGVTVVDEPWHEADFGGRGLRPDVVLPPQVAWCHRTTDAEEIYFLSNQGGEARRFEATFRDHRPYAYLYDPLSDRWRRLAVTASAAGATATLQMDEGGSLFVIFAQRLLPQTLDAPVEKTGEQVVAGPWQLRFEQSGLTMTTDSLFDWSLSPQPRIRYYSGTAHYSTRWTWKGGKCEKILLSLRHLHDVAHVYVNGIDCGIAWTAPYQVDVTKAVRRGINDLRIVVVNTWANALRGTDEGTPPFDGIWTNAKYRMKQPYLLPAGLLGPVVIERYEKQ